MYKRARHQAACTCDGVVGTQTLVIVVVGVADACSRLAAASLFFPSSPWSFAFSLSLVYPAVSLLPFFIKQSLVRPMNFSHMHTHTYLVYLPLGAAYTQLHWTTEHPPPPTQACFIFFSLLSFFNWLPAGPADRDYK